MTKEMALLCTQENWQQQMTQKNKTLTCNSKSNFTLNYNFQKKPKKKKTLNEIRKQLYCIPFFFFLQNPAHPFSFL